MKEPDFHHGSDKTCYHRRYLVMYACCLPEVVGGLKIADWEPALVECSQKPLIL